MLQQVQKLLSDPELTVTEEMQALWSDFGSLVRCFSPKLNKHIIVKRIAPPAPENSTHPRGWNTTTSHVRKLKSYQIESEFYRHYAKQTDNFSAVPRLIASESNENSTLLIMEDLAELGFSETRETGTEFIVKKGIHWLAHFHAKFIHTSANNLWQQGGYWHLATRQDELKRMPDCELKELASEIDNKLKRAKFQTLLHGDAKLQNMCFNPDTGNVAAVDFQYVGKGVGVLDLIYFLGSAFKQDDLYQYNESLFEYYLTTLKSALKQYQVELNFNELEQEYRALYCFAWADFYRFLLGWNPDSWKVNDFIAEMSNMAVQSIKD